MLTEQCGCRPMTQENLSSLSLFSFVVMRARMSFSLYTSNPLKTHSCHFHSHINSHCSLRIWRAKETERERELRMEEEFQGRPAELQLQCCSARIMSPEIVEIGDESKTIISSSDRGATDVYVAVGKDDIDVLKWALDHAVSPGCCVFLIHVFPPLTYIPTPVGRLARSQLSQEQLRVYINEENNRRRNLLQKYIRLCTDAKVTVDTLLLESNTTSKAILQLIPVLNITNLVIGTKNPLSTRLLGKRMAKGEFVKKNAPECCEVTIVYEGKKVDERHQEMGLLPSSQNSGCRRRRSGKNLFECVCLFSRSGSD
ncbi:U-box domain-containing protein 33-like [Cucurbita pepo subsp. pepo]|uniref:U-box domain-containing protein 33-like n=1 Tax=Cucurbita pepo subsp. pepo TaxID=3664 RepID=UPI000C9D42DA|nr:U-box domain-containing protein 33-like [Cucurbita pepo subsp. pepo]